MAVIVPESRWRRLVMGIVLLGIVGGVAALVATRNQTREPPPTQPPTMMPAPFVWPGIQQPPAKRAAEADLSPTDEVIGVTVSGKPRPYAVGAFAGTSRHVVNDLVDDVPVSVTVCDRTNCARVFTDTSRGSPLNLWLGGWNEGMLIRLPQGFYRQEDGMPNAPNAPPFPYGEMAFERTTWAKWRTAHPDTDVYIGPPIPESPPELAPTPREVPGR